MVRWVMKHRGRMAGIQTDILASSHTGTPACRHVGTQAYREGLSFFLWVINLTLPGIERPISRTRGPRCTDSGATPGGHIYLVSVQNLNLVHNFISALVLQPCVMAFYLDFSGCAMCRLRGRWSNGQGADPKKETPQAVSGPVKSKPYQN